jgi:hypothetical protein
MEIGHREAKKLLRGVDGSEIRCKMRGSLERNVLGRGTKKTPQAFDL